MRHVSEEHLVLFHYGDAAERTWIEQHVSACDACRAEYESLKRTLAAVEALPVPERNEAYGREVWARLQPELAGAPRAGWWAALAPQQWALAATMAVVLIVGVLIGRLSGPVSPNGTPTAEQVRERVLLVAVGDHLEESQMVLVELINQRENGTLDISAEKEWADDLIGDNRLYRQTAMLAGDTALSNLLGELERVLLEIARSPDKIDSEEFRLLREQIEEEGILFKIRVVSSEVREREETGWQDAPVPLEGQS